MKFLHVIVITAMFGVHVSHKVFHDISKRSDDVQESMSYQSNKVIETFHVRSDIRYRFATTQISSLVHNTDLNPQVVDFDLSLPKEAFIVDFFMLIDGKRYDGQVKERLAAKRQYQAAVDRGQNAGHVRQVVRHANTFEVSVNAAGGSKVNFTLVYQEQLRRKRGFYDYSVYINLGQPVRDFNIQVFIRENKPLRFVRIPALKSGDLLTHNGDSDPTQTGLSAALKRTPETSDISYSPTLSEQGDSGLTARFTVQFDVEDGGLNGDILIQDGYFAHFFTPDVPTHTLPKDIIFVLDVSGSMSHIKIDQLKDAMGEILSDLQPHDQLNIFAFESEVVAWKEGLNKAVSSIIESAKSYVSELIANGGTNINDALLDAINTLKNRRNLNNERIAMVFFLTDGQPSSGETRPEYIIRNIASANDGSVAIFSLAFGNDADFGMLKTISAQNNGFARKIYEATDAALQVESLYDDISAVSIKDMRVIYYNDTVDATTLTQTAFPIVFNGTDVVVFGKVDNQSHVLKYEVSGIMKSEKLYIKSELDKSGHELMNIDTVKPSPVSTSLIDYTGFVEKMWAYTTIKQLLKEKEKHAGNIRRVKEIDSMILDTSLKYKFVTPLTSMVVTEPNEKENELISFNGSDESEDENELAMMNPTYRANMPSGGGSGKMPGGGLETRELDDHGQFQDTDTSFKNNAFFIYPGIITFVVAFFWIWLMSWLEVME